MVAEWDYDQDGNIIGATITETMSREDFNKKYPSHTVSRCQCDYDYDDGRYFKCSNHCPLHDMCTSCDEYLGRVVRGKEFLCDSCDREE